jgi:hypothetical protein
MFRIQTASDIRLIPILIGLLFIGLALWDRQFLHLLRLRPMSEVFTTPRYQRSARVTERLGRLCLVLFGIGFALEGLGPYFPQPGLVYLAKVAIWVLSGLTVLAIIGTVLANR